MCSTGWYTSNCLVKAVGLKACLCTQRHCIKAIILVHCTKGLFLCTFAFWGVLIAKSKILFVLSKLVAVMVGQTLKISISLLKSSTQQMMLWILTQTKHALFQPLTFGLSSRSCRGLNDSFHLFFIINQSIFFSLVK